MCWVLYSCAGLEAAQKHGPIFLIMLGKAAYGRGVDVPEQSPDHMTSSHLRTKDIKKGASSTSVHRGESITM